MAITLPYTFVSGSSRLASEVQANAEVCRTFLNGRVATTDLAAGALAYENILKPEHYGAPLKASFGVTGDVWGDRANMDLSERATFFAGFNGQEYQTVPQAARTVKIERTSWVKITCRFYAWCHMTAEAAGSTAESYVAAYAALFNGGAIFASTRRRIAARDEAASIDFQPRREHSIHYYGQFPAGDYDLHLRAWVLQDQVATTYPTLIDDMGAYSPLNYHFGDLSIEARCFRVEVDP